MVQHVRIKSNICFNKSRSEPGNAPPIGIGHREVVCQSSCKIRHQITKLWTGLDLAARSGCDLDLQGNDPNIVRDTSS